MYENINIKIKGKAQSSENIYKIQKIKTIQRRLRELTHAMKTHTFVNCFKSCFFIVQCGETYM